jgi:hypothetical protein
MLGISHWLHFILNDKASTHIQNATDELANYGRRNRPMGAWCNEQRCQLENGNPVRILPRILRKWNFPKFCELITSFSWCFLHNLSELASFHTCTTKKCFHNCRCVILYVPQLIWSWHLQDWIPKKVTNFLPSKKWLLDFIPSSVPFLCVRDQEKAWLMKVPMNLEE